MNSQYKKLDTIPEGIKRPFFSVMVPAYSNFNFLEQALKSVLLQDFAPQEMQIEVIGDTIDGIDPEQIIKNLNTDRIQFTRQAKKNLLGDSFNSCIERAKGYWVHILHTDDYVKNGFYKTIATLAKENPQAALIFTPSFIIDEKNNIKKTTPRIKELEVLSKDPSPLFYLNHLRMPATVVQRAFYENYGGFNSDLIYTLDWEMWIRAISKQGGICTNKPFAYYRIHNNSQTSLLTINEEYLKDKLYFAKIIEKEFPDFNYSNFTSQVINETLDNAIQRLKFRQWKSFQILFQLWWTTSNLIDKLKAIPLLTFRFLKKILVS